ncbi:DUF3426 domain-containing protein [Biformimicrobium ophioploci]|uniref:DUF3426 domain-containing protein n=1 Tax=Biformimicrobium ophioploci TaxID=3036711 RepID=A0ABQ6LUG1_9GAMM|nr:DUF3426 domain-containing protein [Microbulbifer sp. NKW57]GMG85710.1 DUF3426 domain-containing protein [Microbulbifer sp. NKW57]
MSQLVTRCPHCSTSFHISSEQLQAARGSVRCGSCLKVFRADENLLDEDGNPLPPARDQAQEQVDTRQPEGGDIEGDDEAITPGKDRDFDALLDDDDFLIHDDADIGIEEDEPEARDQKEDAVFSDAFPTEDETPAKASSDLLEENEAPLIELGDEADTDKDEDWAEALLGDGSTREENRFDSNYAESMAPADAEDAAAFDTAESSPQSTSGDASLEEEPEEEDVEPPRDEEWIRRASEKIESGGRGHLISAIEPAPLEVNWQPKRDRRLPGWAWGLLVLVLAAGAVAQVAYFRFDSLSKQQPWRDLYAAACPHLGCKLPALVDLKQIRASNLVVRSHPQIQDALVVDAVIVNRAPYAQPFPHLLLSFTDLKNQPVAARRFSQKEYLRGELAGRRNMPANQPVHIALEIADPGSEAVNYRMQISH